MKTTKLICMLLLLSLGLAACGDKAASTGTGAKEPAPQDLLEVYGQVYQAMKAGDVAVVRAKRDPERVEAEEKMLAEQGSKMTGSVLKVYAASWEDAKGYSLTDTKTSQDRVRLVLTKSVTETNAAGGSRVKYLVLMFRKLPDGWKFRDNGITTLSQGQQLSEESLPDVLKLQ